MSVRLGHRVGLADVDARESAIEDREMSLQQGQTRDSHRSHGVVLGPCGVDVGAHRPVVALVVELLQEGGPKAPPAMVRSSTAEMAAARSGGRRRQARVPHQRRNTPP